MSLLLSGAPASTDAVHLASALGGTLGAAQVLVLVAQQNSLPLVSASNKREPPLTAETEIQRPELPAFEAKGIANINARALAARDGLRVAFKHTATNYNGIMIAAVTTTHRIKLFTPTKDPANSDWVEVADLLPQLLLLYRVNTVADGDQSIVVDSSVADLLETCSLSWSELWVDNISFLSISSRLSFLAVGSKDGTITLWRFEAANPHKPIYQASIKPQSGWVTKTSWSHWVTVTGSSDSPSIQYCYMISSYANGSVYAHLMTFDPTANNLIITTTSQLSQADSRSVSVIKFYNKDASLIRATFTKGNTINVWTAPKVSVLSHNHQQIVYASPKTDQQHQPQPQEQLLLSHGNLQKLQLSITMAVGGITWSLLGDEIHVYSVDGKSLTIAVIPESSTSSGWNRGTDTPPNGVGGSNSSSGSSSVGSLDDDSPSFGNGVGLVLLEDTTQQFYQEILDPDAKTGGGDEDGAAGGDEDAAGTAADSYGKQIRYYGAVSSPNGLVDFVLYTISLSEGLEYRTGKTNNCHVLVHWNYAKGNRAVEDSVINHVMGAVERKQDLLFRTSPAHLLWDVLGLMHQGGEDDEVRVEEDGLVARLVRRLGDYFAAAASGSSSITQIPEQDKDPKRLLSSTRETLFSNPRMNSLRLLNYIYIHLINSVPTTNKTETASILLNNYQILLREYVVTVLRSVQKYLSDPKIVLSETDLLMLTLVSDLCLQHTKFMVDMLKQLVTIFLLVKQRNSEEHILSICDEYLLKTKAVLTGSAAVVGESKEHCLACSGAIVFQSPWKAVCANGHPWDRCAVSLLTAATPKTRSCLGCNRKTISPEILGEDADESMDGKDQVESVIMKTLLTHITLCVYCGNRLKM